MDENSSESAMDDASMDDSEQEHEFEYDIDEGDDDDPHDDYGDVPDDEDDMDEDDDDDGDSPLGFSAAVSGFVDQLRFRTDPSISLQRFRGGVYPLENLMVEGPMISIAPRDDHTLRSVVLETVEALTPRDHLRHVEALRMVEPLGALTSRFRGSLPFSSLQQTWLRDVENVSSIHPHLQRPRSPVRSTPMSAAEAMFNSLTMRNSDLHSSLFPDRSQQPNMSRDSVSNPYMISESISSIRQALDSINLRSSSSNDASPPSAGDSDAITPASSAPAVRPMAGPAGSSTVPAGMRHGEGTTADGTVPYSEGGQPLDVLAGQDLLRSVSSAPARQSVDNSVGLMHRNRGPFGRLTNRDREREKIPSGILKRWVYDPPSCGGDSLPSIFDSDSGQRGSRQNARATSSTRTQPLIALEQHESVNDLSTKIAIRLDTLLVDLYNIDDELAQRERQEELKKEAEAKKAEDEKKAAAAAKEAAAEPKAITSEQSEGAPHEPPSSDAVANEVAGESGADAPEPVASTVQPAQEPPNASFVEEVVLDSSSGQADPTTEAQPLAVGVRVEEDEHVDVVDSGPDTVMRPQDEAPSTSNDGQDQPAETENEEANNEQTDSTDFAAVAARRAAAAGISLDAPANESPEVVQAATESTGIDPAFLAALPDDMRTEILTQHYEQIRTNAGPEAGAAASPAATTVNQDFLIALPPGLRAEVLELEAEFQSRHEAGQSSDPNAQGGASGSQAAGGVGAAAASGMAATEMENAMVLATLPPHEREDILRTSGEAIQYFPPNVVAEARILRERDMNSRMPWRPNGGDAGLSFPRRTFPSDFIGGSSLPVRRGVRTHSRAAPIYQWKKVENRWLRDGPNVADEPIASLKLEGLASLVHLLWLRQGQYGRTLVYQVLAHACKTTASRLQVLEQLIKLITSSTTQDIDVGAVSKFSGPELDRSRHHGTAVRRGMELLTLLCKNDAVVAENLLGLPQTDEQLKDIPTEVSHISAFPESLSSEISLSTLVALLNTALFKRSNAHLEQLVVVISTVCQAIPPNKCHYSARRGGSRNGGDAGRSRGQETESPHEIAPDSDRLLLVDGDDEGRSVLHVDLEDDADSYSELLERSLREQQDASRREQEATQTPKSESEVSIAVQYRVPFLRPEEVIALTKVLLRPGCTERTYEKASRSIGQLGELPSNREIFVHSLVSIANDSGEEILKEYQRFIAALRGKDNSRVVERRADIVAAFSVASASNELTLLRVVKSFCTLLKHETEQSKTESPETAAGVDGEELTEPLPARSRFQPSMLNGLQSLWDALDTLLELVSHEAGLKDKKMPSNASGPRTGGELLNLDRVRASSRGLSPVLARLSPMIEAFLVTHSSGDDVSAEDADPRSPSSPLLTTNESSISSASIGSVSRMSDRAMDSTSRQKDGELSIFVERHRGPINALLRANPPLLETSFKGALKHPHAIDFDNKKAYFRNVIRRRSSEAHAGTLRINVRREQVFNDSYHSLRKYTPEQMKGRLHVQFTGEEGVDAGGVTREWYIILARQIFDPNYVLFCRSAAKAATYQPDKRSYINREHLENFRFVGRIIGKAIYDGQLLDAYFTRSFYKHILGLRPTYHDIEAQDPDYYKSLKWMLENDITGVFDYTMSAEYDEFGKSTIIDFMPNGRNIPVTEDNKAEYVRLVTEVRMTKAIEKQIEAFKEGFYELIPHEDCKIFNALELELLMSGLPDIDVADLKANVEYTGYTASSPQINWFWRCVGKMDQEDLARLVMFVTGTSKVPLEGFSTLQGMNGVQKFQIHRTAGNTLRLPSAHTCFNQLDLPEYSSAEVLSERLLRAVQECSVGFGFA